MPGYPLSDKMYSEVNNYTTKINLPEIPENYKDIFLQLSIFEFPDLGEKIYGNIIIHKMIQEYEAMDCLCVEVRTMNEKWDEPYKYIFINTPDSYLIEKIIDDSDKPYSWRPVEITDGLL